MKLLYEVIARRRAKPGWIYPMGWFAWFGMLLPILFGANQIVQNIVFAWSGWIAMWTIGAAGTLAIAFESCRNLRRYGVGGLSRPRSHFEIGRFLIAATFLLNAPILTAGLLLPGFAEFAFIGFANIRLLTYALATAFCIIAITGYLLSYYTGKKCRGRAFECTNYFFTIGGGIALLTFGYIAIPEHPKTVIEVIPGAIVCIAGIAMFMIGTLFECTRESAAVSTAV